jgi:hypothetical protein
MSEAESTALDLLKRMVAGGHLDWQGGFLYGDDYADTIDLTEHDLRLLDAIWDEQEPAREARLAAERIRNEQRAAESIEQVWTAMRFTPEERALFEAHGYDHRDVIDFVADTQPGMYVVGGRKHNPHLVSHLV